MTYQDLVTFIAKHPEILEQDVTVYDGATDEFFPSTDSRFADSENDVLDHGHFFLIINED